MHLEGAIRPATLLAIAGRNGQGLPADTVEGLSALYEYRDFRHFIDVWILTTNCLCTRGDFRQVAVDYAAEAAGFGAVYLEAMFSPCERVMRGVGWSDIFDGYTDGAAQAQEQFGVTVRFTPDRGLVLDVCPTSNLRTGAVPSLAAHPLPALRAAGVACTVNTDDPAMFGTDLGHEYALAAGLGVSAYDAFTAGIAGALCDEATRARLAALL